MKVSEEVRNNKTFLTAVTLIMLLGFVLRAYGLSNQALSSDDYSVAHSASNFVKRGHFGVMWNHPNLRNLLVYLSMWFLGGGVWGLKLVSLTLGTLTIPLVGLIANRIFKNKEVALMAALFMAIEPLHIDFSRQAVHEVYMAFFALAGIYFALKFMDKVMPLFLIISGIFFGLGIASKWDVAFPLFVTYIFIISPVVRSSLLSTSDKFKKTIFISSALVILPFTIYLLTFIPWFKRGYSISEWLILQNAMYLETKTHMGYMPYQLEVLDHKAYLWFIKPIAYADFALKEGQPTILIGYLNPAVSLLAIPSMIYLIYKGIKKKIIEYCFLSALFCFSYIPLLIVKRPIWVHTAFSVIPYVFMAVSYTVCDIVKGKRKKTFLSIYLALVILIFAPLYLLAIGKGLEIDFLRPIVEIFRPLHER